MTKSKKTDTLLVSGGRRKEWTNGIVNPPVYRASTCIFETYGEMKERVADMYGHSLFYGRKGTPTHWALCDALNELEGGEGCLLYPSGMSAVCTAISCLLETGDHILVVDSAYEPTRSFADNYLAKMGVSCTYYDPLIGAGIKDLIQDNTKVILTESPGSLTFEVQDIPAICDAAHAAGAYVVLDNTWATPLLFDGFAAGVDIIVHAATKYIVGHSDVMMGAAIANKATWKRLRDTTFGLGLICSADDAALALRGLRTLGVRLKQHETSALKVAAWLKDHPMVDQLLHPAFEGCPGQEFWQRDFSGSSGLFSIVLKSGTYDDTAALVDDLEHFKMGFSWGGYESLILPSDPARVRGTESWPTKAPLIRLHIGLEDVDDLIEDLSAGLDRYAAHLGL